MNFKFNPEQAELAKRVTLPFLKQKVGQPTHIYFLERYCKSRKINDDEQKGEATLGHVINLTTGEESDLILSTVTKSLLDEHYPEGAYVGKAFKIELFAVEGKKYHKVDMVELKLDSEQKAWLDSERKRIMNLPENLDQSTGELKPQVEKAQMEKPAVKTAGK